MYSNPTSNRAFISFWFFGDSYWKLVVLARSKCGVFDVYAHHGVSDVFVPEELLYVVYIFRLVVDSHGLPVPEGVEGNL